MEEDSTDKEAQSNKTMTSLAIENDPNKEEASQADETRRNRRLFWAESNLNRVKQKQPAIKAVDEPAKEE